MLDPARGDYRPPPSCRRAAAVRRADEGAAPRRPLPRGDGRPGTAPAARTPTCCASVVLGYVSYGLSRVGEVVARPRDVDRIMGFGFNWAPPSVLVDAIGARRTVALLERAEPAGAARRRRGRRDATSPCSTSPHVDSGASSSRPRSSEEPSMTATRLHPRRLPDRLRPQLDQGRQAHLGDDPRGGEGALAATGVEPGEVQSRPRRQLRRRALLACRATSAPSSSTSTRRSAGCRPAATRRRARRARSRSLAASAEIEAGPLRPAPSSSASSR